MLEPSLFPGLATPEPRGRCGPRHRPPSPRPRDASRTSHVVDRLRFDHGRRVVSTHVGLRPSEIAELARAARFGPIVVRYSIATPDRRLAAVLDPRAPSPYLRLASLRAARRAGLVAGVVISPLIPGVNDHEGDLRRVFSEARRAGAAFVEAEVVIPGEKRLAALVRDLRRSYPRVAARHEVWRRTSSLAPHEERGRIEALLETLRRRFDMPSEAPYGVDRPGGPRDSGSQHRFSFAV